MEFKEVVKIRDRMCEHYVNGCSHCPMYLNKIRDMSCNDFIMTFPASSEKIISTWAEEHPQKTILMDFLEKYPNAKLDEDGTPEVQCPYHLGYDEDDDCIYEEDNICCEKCWNRPMEE